MKGKYLFRPERNLFLKINKNIRSLHYIYIFLHCITDICPLAHFIFISLKFIFKQMLYINILHVILLNLHVFILDFNLLWVNQELLHFTQDRSSGHIVYWHWDQDSGLLALLFSLGRCFPNQFMMKFLLLWSGGGGERLIREGFWGG